MLNLEVVIVLFNFSNVKCKIPNVKYYPLLHFTFNILHLALLNQHFNHSFVFFQQILKYHASNP